MRRPVSPALPLTTSAPLPLSEFWSDLRFAAGEPPELSETSAQNQTAGGEVIGASWGARLWRFSVSLAAMAADDLDVLAGRLSLLADGGRTFLAVPPYRAAPIADPDGRFIAGSSPQIATLPSGGTSLTLSGLPAGYQLTAGDFLSFERSVPARYELHRLVTGGTANTAGFSPVLQVVPALRPGVTVGAAVKLVNPVMRGRIVPGSLRMAARDLAIGAGPSFEVIQTMQKAEA